MSAAPFSLPRHLLWEFDYEQFDYDAHYRIAIERVIERGGMEEWRAAQRYYGRDRFLEVVDWSRQLSERDKDFARLFVESAYHDAHAG